jgi:hypothetical protein
LKKIDAVLAWVMILLGVLHCGAAWITIRGFAVGAIWGFAGGVALIEAGLLNLVRQSAARGIALAGSIIGNILLTLLVVSVGLTQLSHLVRHLPFLVVAVAVIGELLFSLRGK